MAGWWTRVARSLKPRNPWLAKGTARGRAPAATAARQALVKSRPASLEQTYEILDVPLLADELFARLGRDLFGAAERLEAASGTCVVRERGRLAPGRPYLFLKRLGETGVLIERAGAGWMVSHAEKIVAQDLFLREGAPLDAIVLYYHRQRAVLPRVRSRAGGDELLAFAVYEQRLLEQLGL
jgi:hypothetical protein